jgi:hypothetical protein
MMQKILRRGRDVAVQRLYGRVGRMNVMLIRLRRGRDVAVQRLYVEIT